jgi:nitrite reductase/ring-hydroxylating ferredoxin subunit
MIGLAKVLIGKASDTPEGKLTHISAGGKEIVIANVGGSYYAMGNICNHAGAELHEGEISGKELTCPWHGAKWDITTGNLLWFPQKLNTQQTFKVNQENDSLYVEIT